jgi:MFS family permease
MSNEVVADRPQGVATTALRPGSTAWLLALCAVQLGTLLVFMNFAGALPLIQADWGLSNAQAGAIQAARQFGYVVAVLILSSLTDYVRAERLIAGSALWAGLSNLAFAQWAGGASSGMALRALTGVGIAGIYMPGMKLISQCVPAERRGRAVGLFVSSFTLGAAASIALGGGLAATLGWRTAFALTSVGPLAGALISWRVLSPAAALMVGEKQTAVDRAAKRGAGRPITEVFRNRPALLAITAYTAHAWEVLGLRSWLPAFMAAALVQAGVGLGEATRRGATMAGVATVMGAVGVALVATLSDRFGRPRTIMVIVSGGLVSILALGFTMTLPWALIVGVSLLAALLANADSAVISTTLTESVPAEILGRVLGVYSFLGFSAGAIAPLVFGAVLDSVTTRAGATAWTWAFATLALGSVVALAAAAALHRERPADGGD